MLLTVYRRLATLDIVARDCSAGVMLATFVNDVYHAILSMLLAIHCVRLLAALDIVARHRRAGVV